MGLHFYLKTEKETIFTAYITHNLVKMAKAADIYQVLWRSEQIKDNVSAIDLIRPLADGLLKLEDDPKKYKVHNPANGFGNYEGFVDSVWEILCACIKHRDAVVKSCV